jgi:flagellar basal-body rod protein FlgG
VTDALEAAAASLSSDLARMTTLGHNLANATTPGYKRQLAAVQPFQSSLAQQEAALSRGALATAIDQKQGTLRMTSAPLDLAIDGDGFFELRTGAGAAYTRRGDFRVDASAQLVTQGGHLVMGQGGPLMLRSAAPVITKDGRVLEDGQEVGQLKLVSFSDPRSLTASEGGAVFTAPEAAQALAPERAPRVLQGHLEASNVNTAAEMVKLIETVRHFESVQKVVQGFDEMRERALRKLGEF